MMPSSGLVGTGKVSTASDADRTCRHCGIAFASKNELHRHIRSEHQASAPSAAWQGNTQAMAWPSMIHSVASAEPSSETTCRSCLISFPSKNALHRHIRSGHQANAGGSAIQPGHAWNSSPGFGSGMMNNSLSMGSLGSVNQVSPMGVSTFGTSGGFDQQALIPLHLQMHLNQVCLADLLFSFSVPSAAWYE